MKKALMLSVFVSLLVIASIAMVSAQPVGTTAVVGKVYNADYSETIKDATVNVTCIHGGASYFSSTTSRDDGSYLIQFTAAQCDLGDSISVSGYHPDYGFNTGDGTKINVDMDPLDIALGVSNIALIPEFGFFVGALTLLSAVGIFFLVRRE